MIESKTELSGFIETVWSQDHTYTDGIAGSLTLPKQCTVLSGTTAGSINITTDVVVVEGSARIQGDLYIPRTLKFCSKIMRTYL